MRCDTDIHDSRQMRSMHFKESLALSGEAKMLRYVRMITQKMCLKLRHEVRGMLAAALGHSPTVVQSSILGNDGDAISHVARFILIRIAFRQSIDDLDVAAYAAILVEYGAVYEAS